MFHVWSCFHCSASFVEKPVRVFLNACWQQLTTPLVNSHCKVQVQNIPHKFPSFILTVHPLEFSVYFDGSLHFFSYFIWLYKRSKYFLTHIYLMCYRTCQRSRPHACGKIFHICVFCNARCFIWKRDYRLYQIINHQVIFTLQCRMLVKDDPVCIEEMKPCCCFSRAWWWWGQWISQGWSFPIMHDIWGKL